MCLEDKDHHHSEKTASVLVPYGHLKGKLTPLPRVVDHREEQTEGDIRNQGTAGTCTSFGTASSIDHSVTRWSGTSSHVSTMELWGRYHQTDLGDGAHRRPSGQTFASEDAWPYDPKLAWTWRDCPTGGAAGRAEGPCGKPVDKAKLAELAKKPAVVVEQVEWLPKDFQIMRQKIAGGEDPVFAMKLPPHFVPIGKPGAKYIADYQDEAGGHALSLAGYYLGDKGDNYYLVHNSWGPNWGDGGYAWVHEATLAKHMMNGFGIIDARPINGEKSHREGKTCPAGHAPDSHTGACAAECKDGSPMHNGVCPEASDCPAGFVNPLGVSASVPPRATRGRTTRSTSRGSAARVAARTRCPRSSASARRSRASSRAPRRASARRRMSTALTLRRVSTHDEVRSRLLPSAPAAANPSVPPPRGQGAEGVSRLAVSFPPP